MEFSCVVEVFVFFFSSIYLAALRRAIRSFSSLRDRSGVNIPEISAETVSALLSRKQFSALHRGGEKQEEEEDEAW